MITRKRASTNVAPMRVLEFSQGSGGRRVGLLSDDGSGVIDLSRRLGDAGRSLLAVLDNGLALDVHAGEQPDIALDEIDFEPLLADTGRVFAAGLNYAKVYPAGKQPPTPTHPPWFSKMPGTLVGHERPVVAPRVHESFDYEAELAAVLGRGGRHVPADDALDLVAGWTCLNDGSVRAWQRHSVNAGKNFERSGSIGPWMVTADEIDDPQDLRLMARVDGELRQDASTGEMLFTAAEIISYLSQIIELRPGDVIATGSPEGTGGSFDPPRFLVPGQVVEVEVEGIGTLRNPVIAEEAS